MRIFKDIIRKQLGLGTKKESLDKKIDAYCIKEINDTNYSIAIRNQLISALNERIRQLEKIINNNQKIIDLCEFIKNKSIEQIKDATSPVQNEIYNKNGEIIIKSNYKVMCDYLSSLLNKGLNTEFITFYNKQLSNVLEKNWKFYASSIINGKGSFNNEECYEIYTAYVKIIDLMNNGCLKNEKNISIKFNENGINLILKIYNYTFDINNFLSQSLQNLKNQLEILNFDNQSEEYILKQINETKQILKSSEEYTQAKASHDYLEQIQKR